MPSGSVLVLATDESGDAAQDSLAAHLAAHLGAIVVTPEPGAGSITSRLCLAINVVQPTAPLVIVALGAAADALPAVALAQRTAHRRVAEYLLVDGAIPSVSDTWPDAPVTVATDDPEVAKLSRLRGWPIKSLNDAYAWRPASV